MTVKEMGRLAKARRPFFYFCRWRHFFVQISRGQGQRPSRRSRFSGASERYKLQEFATSRVIGHMPRQLGFGIGIQERQEWATFLVDVVNDQLSWR
jgi:hypothetical protein